MSVMVVQTKCKLNNTELFLELFHIQCKEIGNSKYYEETTELEWQSETSPEYLSRETLRFSGNKIHCSPRDQSLSVKC